MTPIKWGNVFLVVMAGSLLVLLLVSSAENRKLESELGGCLSKLARTEEQDGKIVWRKDHRNPDVILSTIETNFPSLDCEDKLEASRGYAAILEEQVAMCRQAQEKPFLSQEELELVRQMREVYGP